VTGDGLDAVTSVETLSPEWVTAVLRHAGVAGATVDTFQLAEVGTGQMGASYRLLLDYAGGRPEAAPGSLIAKFASTDPRSRETGRAMGYYEAEVCFYREVAPRISMRVPHCWHAFVGAGGAESVILLEDVAPAEQGDQVAGCTVDEAALAMEELPRLHAPCWADPAFESLAWLNRRTPETTDLLASFLPVLLPQVVDHFGDRLSARATAVAESLIPAVGGWMRSHPGPNSVQHGDYRIDNMLLSPAGDPSAPPLTVVDWQTVVWGSPVLDASYFLGGSLCVDDRRTHERDLLGLYHGGLTAAGIEDLSWERCWSDYRRFAYAGFLVAAGASVLTVHTERGDEMFLAMIDRHTEQIEDLGSAEFLAS
jgi:Ecdysteroid kinase-like family